MFNAKKVLSGLCAVAMISAMGVMSASAETSVFDSKFNAPTGGDDVTTPGGDWTQNEDGSIAIVNGANPWHEYRIYKDAVEVKDGSYTVEVTFKGGFPEYGCIGIAVGLPDSTTPFGFAEAPDSGKNTKGLVARYIRVGADLQMIPGGCNADGDYIWADTQTIMTWADYDSNKEYTIKAVVTDTPDEAVKAATIFFENEQIGPAINFKSAGNYVALIAQQAYKDGDPSDPVVIKNVKINGTVVAGVDQNGGSTPAPDSKPDSKPNTDSSTTTPPTGYAFPIAAVAVLAVSALGAGVAVSAKKRK